MCWYLYRGAEDRFFTGYPGVKGLQASTLHPGKVSAIALKDFHRLVNEPRTLMIVASFNTPVG